jgi:hypothetical protein
MMFRRYRLQWAGVLTAFVIAGCDKSGTEPTIRDVSGIWEYSASNVSGAGVSCSVTGTLLYIDQTEGLFTGSYDGGTFWCSGPGGTFSQTIVGGIVVNGIVDGPSVRFDFDDSSYRHTGTVTGNAMSGSVVLNVDLGSPSGVVTLTGEFVAVRD